jgi:peroxiredoxin-like protein
MTPAGSYQYQLNLEWTGQRTGELTAEGLTPLQVAPPPEFKGPGGQWTPEHLLVAATASCLMTTFLAIAEISKLAVLSFRMESYGRLEKVPEEGYRFTEIKLAPEIGVAPEDEERARKLLEKAGKNCFISKSLRATVQVEPRFVSLPAAVAR